MSIVEKIPCTIVTGFLGAGKTTLVRHLVENAGGRRLAIIVNEFGDIGFDGSFLAACGIEGCGDEDIVELANGCICCTVADDFVPALKGLLDRPSPPEHIVIETSGLALPKPLVKAFNWPEIASRVTVDGVVAVVDGAAVAAPGKWTYVVGHLDPDRNVPDMVHFARLHRASADGLTVWRERPDHVRKNTIARVPPMPIKEPSI